MVTGLFRSTDPTSWLGVTRAEMEAQLSISADYESARTDSVISAATEWVQERTSQSILQLTQAYTMTLSDWPRRNGTGAIYLPYGPVTGVTLNYVDTTGATSALVLDTDFKLNGGSARIPFITPINDWPTLYSADNRDVITIVYTVGYSSVPNWAKEAIKAYGTYLYEMGEPKECLAIAERLTRSNRAHFNLNDNR